MIKSMTGYGKAEGVVENKKISVEVRSLNGKFLDCSLRVPGLYRQKEMLVRSKAAKEVVRGKVDISISYESLEGEQNFFINRKLLKNYYQGLSEVSKELNISEENVLGTLMKMPEVMRSEKQKLSEGEWFGIEKLIDEALVSFNSFRLAEGGVLQKEVEARINEITSLLVQVEPFESERIETVKTRIRKNIDEIVSKDGFDQNRFEQELIFYMERYDITEEKVRLKAHCEHFIKTMKDEQAQGKKLGFISQEIGREINTLGSKANHAEMQKIVVQMKDELEKIKEQALNIM
ncbi:MAG: YicC family protein [Flavobacteriales bacterium]|nr:YicC family protein [Flavobacteriales bacterium]